MLNLGSFFAPLNFFNTSIFLLYIGCCEVIGYRLTRLFVKEIPFFLRGAIWLLGFGIIVFVYFLSHFFVPLSYPTVFFILIILMLLSAKFYVDEMGYKSVLGFLKNNTTSLIIILTILPIIFVKSSLPPYMWDEMAYHYISPYTLYFEKVWNFGNGFYQNLPRVLDTGYVSLFSLTKTYAVARLLSFTIFITFLITAYSFIKERFGLVAATAFFVLTLFYKENFLLWSTFGYVDIGTMSFVMIGFFLLLDYFFDKKIESLQFGLAFFGMAVGSKYSALTQFLTFFVFSVFILIRNKGAKFLLNKKLLVGLILFFVLGGYWYFKNLIVTGNPIYPILFGCKFPVCESIDFGYTTPLIFSNILAIFSRVFLGQIFLERAFMASVILLFTIGDIKAKKTTIFVLVFVAVEILFVRNITGYDGRYFYHWPILAILVVILPTSVLKGVGAFKKWKG